MNFKALFIVCLCFLSTSIFAQNKTLPDVTISTLDGQPVNIQDYAKNGKITVLSFWATWCSPCKKELDNLAPMYDDLKEKYNVEIIAISTDNTRSLTKVKPMVDAKGWEYEVLIDKKRDLQRALNFQEVPFTFIIDLEGNIVYTHSGYVEGDEYILEDELAKVAGVEEAPVIKKQKKGKKKKTVNLKKEDNSTIIE